MTKSISYICSVYTIASFPARLFFMNARSYFLLQLCVVLTCVGDVVKHKDEGECGIQPEAKFISLRGLWNEEELIQDRTTGHVLLLVLVHQGQSRPLTKFASKILSYLERNEKFASKLHVSKHID